MRRALAGLLAAAVLLTACSPGDDGGPAATYEPGVLRVLAGSELADLAPVLAEAEQATGVRVELEYTGTLEGAESITSGAVDGAYDAVWFSSNRYVSLQPQAQGRLGAAVDVASSPVVLGLRRSVAEALGWVGRPVTWSEIATAAGEGRFTYGMTDPSASNTGFSTVVAVATALAGTGSALTAEQAAATSPGLTAFFSAQRLSAGSSGFLVDAYARRATGADPGPAVDGLVNYESVLLGLNAAGTLPEPLELITPADGVVTAEYPFTVLSAAPAGARDDARRLTDHLRTPDVQRRIMELTARRPAVPGVAPDSRFGAAGVELPFPTSADVVDTLLTSWFDRVRRPSRTVYVLDTSGSMAADDRIGDLRRALAGLSGADTSLVGRYRQFRGREEVTLLPFASATGAPQRFTVPESDPGPVRAEIGAAGNRLTPSGGTAIYDGLTAAYALAAGAIATDPDRFTSIVLMTDGENTDGRDLAAFRAELDRLPPDVRAVPVFTVLFGESAVDEMEEVATLTGGRTFDAREVPLAEVFSEIRGYV